MSFLGREKLLNADCEPQEQAPQPGAAMKGASLLLVLVLAKLAMAWGHASSLTGWSLAAYTWQDVLVALAFAGLDHGLRKWIGVTPRISWGVPRQNHRRNIVTAAKLGSAGVLANYSQ